MSIVLFRIDDRLIHGQVVEGWLNTVRTEIVLVANDIVSNDSMQKTLMTMAIPSAIPVYIENIDNSIERVQEGVFENKRTLVLVSSPKDAYLLIEHGMVPSTINVGGMHFGEGKKQIFEYISVNDDDIRYFFELAKRGIKIEGQTIPDGEKLDVIKELNKALGL